MVSCTEDEKLTVHNLFPSSTNQRTVLDILIWWQIEENLLENLVGKLIDV